MRHFVKVLLSALAIAALGTASAQPSRGPPVLVLDRTVNGSLARSDAQGPNGAYDVYVYRGRAGEVLQIAMTSSQLDSHVEISGTGLIEEIDDGSFDLTSLLTTVLPVDGDYQIIARSNGTGWTGRYSLRLSPSAAIPLTVGAVVNGEFTQASHRSVFSMSGRRGQSARLSLTVGGNTNMSLTGPTGLLGAGDSYPGTNLAVIRTLPEDGTYYVVLRPSSSGASAGPFALRVDLDTPEQAIAAAEQARVAAVQAQAAQAQQHAADLLRVPAMMQRAWQLLNSGDNAGAEAAYDEVLAIDYVNVDARINAGVAMMRQGKYREAGVYFQMELASDPNNAIAATNLAQARAAQQAQQAQLAQQQQQAQQQAAQRRAQDDAALLGAVVGGLNAIANQQAAQQQAAAQQAAAQQQQAAQQRQQQSAQQQQQQASNSNSGSSSSQAASSGQHGHNPANDLTSCVHVVDDRGTGNFQNDCPAAVTVAWPGGEVNLQSGRRYPTMQTGRFAYFACRYNPAIGAGLFHMAGGAVCDGPVS